MRNLVLYVVSLSSLVGCIHSQANTRVEYESRVVSVQTLSLFDQSQPSRLAKTNWRGDWVFRRDRLDLIDRTMRGVKPDIVFLQDVMARGESPSESDRTILGHGALDGYLWSMAKVRDITETDEQNALGVAVGLPLKITDPDPNLMTEAPSHVWTMGEDGGVQLVVIEFEGMPVLLVNVTLPTKAGNESIWYGLIQEKIEDAMKQFHVCHERVIVAGYMPKDADSRRYDELQTRFQLKDASAGFCQAAEQCYTATSVNDIYLATQGDEIPSQVDRIFVSQSAYVLASARNFTTPENNNTYSRSFGLTRLWPTQRFGWVATVRLARCGE